MPVDDSGLIVPSETYERQVHGWAVEALQEGEIVLRREEGYARIQDSIDYVMGNFDRGVRPLLESASVTENRFAKVFTENVASLTDIKPFWLYQTYNDKFQQQATIAGKLSEAWWLNRNSDIHFTDVMKYAMVAGTGYAHLVFDQDWQDMRLIAEDPRAILPIRPHSFETIQDSTGVIIRRERTVNYLRKLYPSKASKIVADRDASFSTAQESTRAGRIIQSLGLRSGFMENLFASIQQRSPQQLRVPALDVFTMYVKDASRNTSSSKVWVSGSGDGDPYGYWVEPGDELYPRGRCIVFTRKAVLRDGPSIYWHGKFPVVKFTVDPVPWSWLGRPPLRDLLALQEELNKLQKVRSQHNERVRKPGISADKNAVSEAMMRKIDTSRSGMQIRYNPSSGQPIQMLYEPPLDPSIPLTMQDIRQSMDELSGVADIRQLMNLNQLPTTETIEHMIETMSGTIKLRSRVLEVAMREVAEQMLSNFFQFYTIPMRVAVLGPRQGVTFEDFDYDPGNLLPAYVGMKGEMNGTPLPAEQRSREFRKQFQYHVAPGSLLAASEVQRKLMYLQLARAGWCDIWTLGEILGINQMGAAPEGADTIPQRLMLQQMMGLGMQVNSAGRKSSGQTMPSATNKGVVESRK